MTRKLGLAVLAVLGTTAVSAQEQGQDTNQYLYAVPFYAEPDDDRRADNGFGFGLGYGWRWTDRLFWEAQGFGTAFDTERSDLTDFFQYGGGLDLTYRIPAGSVTPFGLVGLGGVYNDVVPNSDDEFTVFGNVGVGLLSAPIANGLRIRFEGRYIYDNFEFGDSDGMGDWRVGLGVQVPLGRKVVTKEKEVVREKVVTKEVPATIADSDGDGVPNQNDRCSNTLEGLATDSRGCASQKPQVVRLEGVTFEVDSARLRPSSRETLQRVAEALRGEPNLKVEIAGHTDSTGPAAYNRQLSKRRANSVREYLIREGIDRNRLRARGYGEQQPTATNATEAGRAQNRRVEFRVLN